MKYGVAFVFFLTSITAMAANGDSLNVKPVRYAFTVNSAMMFCGSCRIESSTVAMLTTVHGIKWRKLRVGAGVGYASFGAIRVIPMFGSVSLSLAGKKKQNGLFVELNYGGAHSWLAAHLRGDEFLKDVGASNFTQASAGYAFHYHGLRLAAQVGVHSLQATKTYNVGRPYEYDWGPMNYVIPAQQQLVEYKTTRAFVAISIGF